MTTITEEMLDDLRAQICERMSPKRFLHTVAVEDMVVRLCALFCPDQTLLLRAAALLHDLTKEKSTEEQIQICQTHGLPVSNADCLAHKTFHARTAAALIPTEYPQFADPVILNAVRWHTTGHADMTLTEKLLYLADYIDSSRTFENCVILRRFFWGADPDSMRLEERLALLDQTMILSFDMTVRDLLNDRLPIADDTVAARNALLLLQKKLF